MSQISRPIEQLDIVSGAGEGTDGSPLYQMNVVVTNPPGCANVVVTGPPTHGWIAAYKSLRDKLVQEFAHDHGTITYSDDDISIDQLPQYAMSDEELRTLDEECPSPFLSPQHRPVSPLPELSLPLKQVAPVARMTNKRPALAADRSESDLKRSMFPAGLTAERGPNGTGRVAKDRSGGNRRHSTRRKRIVSAIHNSHEQPKAASTNGAIPTGTIHVGGKRRSKCGTPNPCREVISFDTDEGGD